MLLLSDAQVTFLYHTLHSFCVFLFCVIVYFVSYLSTYACLLLLCYV